MESLAVIPGRADPYTAAPRSMDSGFAANGRAPEE